VFAVAHLSSSRPSSRLRGSSPARLSKTFSHRAPINFRARGAIVSPRFSQRRARFARRERGPIARPKSTSVRKKALTRIFRITKLAHEKGGDASAMAKKAAKKSSKKTTKKTTKKK
jgi:hypothetical protein